jgi:hypothetical protein
MRNLKIMAAVFGALIFFETWLAVALIWVAREFNVVALRDTVQVLHVGFRFYSTLFAGALFLLLVLQSGLQIIWRPRA